MLIFIESFIPKIDVIICRYYRTKHAFSLLVMGGVYLCTLPIYIIHIKCPINMH